MVELEACSPSSSASESCRRVVSAHSTPLPGFGLVLHSVPQQRFPLYEQLNILFAKAVCKENGTNGAGYMWNKDFKKPVMVLAFLYRNILGKIRVHQNGSLKLKQSIGIF